MVKKVKRNKSYYSISAVAKMFTIHQQTIRLYEKEGLVTPKRSEGNTRMFTEEDVDRLEEVIYLTHQLGVNIAGVQMILKLQRQIQKMQRDMNQVFDTAHKELGHQVEQSKQIIESSAKELVRLKQIETKKDTEQDVEEESWEIEYED